MSVLPLWKRKIRNTNRGEKIIQIPKEIADSLNAGFVVITVEDGRIILTPES